MELNRETPREQAGNKTLMSMVGGNDIKWNFGKFLISNAGAVKRCPSTSQPSRQPHPLLGEDGTTGNIFRSSTRTPRQGPGLDCLMCQIRLSFVPDFLDSDLHERWSLFPPYPVPWRCGLETACPASGVSVCHRCRSNMALIRQSRPYSGLGFTMKVLAILQIFPYSLGSGESTGSACRGRQPRRGRRCPVSTRP